MLLGEMFEQMAAHFRPDRAEDLDAVIEWHIRGPERDSHEQWQTQIADGECRVVRDGDLRPRVTFKLSPLQFVKLATNNASGPKLYLRGKLKVEGDLLLAARLQSLFSVPRA